MLLLCFRKSAYIQGVTAGCTRLLYHKYVTEFVLYSCRMIEMNTLV